MKDIEKDVCESEIIHESVVEKVRAALPDEDTLADVAELFKVFGDSTRTRILSALRILRQTKVVKYRKQGKEVYYSLDDEHISRIYKMALEHLSEEK